MIAAAIALAYYGYRGAEDVFWSSRREFVNAAASRAHDLIERVDLAMNDAVNPLFTQLETALDDASIPDKDKCLGLVAHPIVQSFGITRAIPHKNFECIGPERLKPKDIKAFPIEIEHNRNFKWSEVPLVILKYFHTSVDGPSLYAVTKYQAADQQTYFLVAKLIPQMIRAQGLDEGLRRLAQDYRVALVDERGVTLPDAIFGGSEPTIRERFLHEEPLGRQLYAWRLRIAQGDEQVRLLEARMSRQRLVQILLVLLSTVIIAVGMGIVLLSVVAERRASRLKSDFIANVSHELKTPLSLIRMFGEMVATGRHKGEETAREYGAIITRESERLAHLIDNVLDFARLERGKASYDFAEGDLAWVVERALDICRYRLEKEKVKLRTVIDRSLPPVRMDENAMTLVILNLVDNAMKYGAEGGVVEVSLARAPGGVVLGVRDWGPGIPRDEHGHIFERFYRAQSARDRNVRGSGIGLALVRHIALAHGGRVTVESPIPAALGAGPGSLFRVFLPAPEVVGLDEADPAADPEDGRNPPRVVETMSGRAGGGDRMAPDTMVPDPALSAQEQPAKS
jgi:two-component system phosphate regulon sensor histidine kinase PhoR